MICDEFKLIPNLQHIEDGVNFGRSLGVKIFAGLQSIEQLYEIYQESRGKNIAAGFSSIFAFKANDVTTRQYLSDLYGSNYVIEQFMMNNRYEEEKRMGRVIETGICRDYEWEKQSSVYHLLSRFSLSLIHINEKWGVMLCVKNFIWGICLNCSNVCTK